MILKKMLFISLEPPSSIAPWLGSDAHVPTVGGLDGERFSMLVLWAIGCDALCVLTAFYQNQHEPSQQLALQHVFCGIRQHGITSPSSAQQWALLGHDPVVGLPVVLPWTTFGTNQCRSIISNKTWIFVSDPVCLVIRNFSQGRQFIETPFPASNATTSRAKCSLATQWHVPL